MKINNSLNKLLSVEFILAVTLLLINDFYWKYEYSNILTGKISDFAGLFVFPFFFSALLFKRPKIIYFLTAFVFIYWKSSFSQSLIDLFHSYNLAINRTVDITDLVALTILPISYLIFKREHHKSIKWSPAIRLVIIAITIFSFVATSLPARSGTYNMKSSFQKEYALSREIIKDSLNLYTPFFEKYNYTLDIEEIKARIFVTIKLRQQDSLITIIQLDSIIDYHLEGNPFIFSKSFNQKDIDYLDNLSQKEIEKLFQDNVEKELGFNPPNSR